MNHGTLAGYKAHRTNKEDACDACRDAKRDARKLDRASTANRMQLPVELIARLYLAVPGELQRCVDRYLTAPVVDTLVRRHDDAESRREATTR